MSEDDLDALLSRPLAPIDDNGFTARVCRAVALRGYGLAALDGLVALVVAVTVLRFVPLGALARVVTGAAIELSSSLPVAIACAALALTYSAARLMAD